MRIVLESPYTGTSFTINMQGNNATIVPHGQLLGAGGYSQVFLVEYKEKEYAVKCLTTNDNGVISPLEIDTLRRFKHPHLTHADFFYVLTDQSNYLQLWLPRGKKYTSRNRSSDEYAHIFWQLASGLSFLHQHKIIHLDLDLANIVVIDSPQGEIYQLIDLSLARYCPSDVHYSYETATILSSRPPELLLVDSQSNHLYSLTPACDIWSLGLIFLRMVAKENNLYRQRTSEDQYQIFRQYFETPEQARITIKAWVNDADLIDLLVMMLSWRPQDRPCIDQVLTHPYFQQYHFVLPEGEITPESKFNLDVDLDISETLYMMMEEFIIPLRENLPARIVVRGVDLFYRTMATSPKPKFLHDPPVCNFYLLVSLILACKLDDIYIAFDEYDISTTEYIEAEKFILSRLQGYLCHPLRPTLDLITLRGYAKAEVGDNKEFFNQSAESLLWQLYDYHGKKLAKQLGSH